MEKTNVYIQSGSNPDFPRRIKIWKLGDPVPEWLSDKAKVIFLDGDGNITLDIIDTNSGGVSIKSSNGIDVLVNLNRKSDYVCSALDEDRIFSLNPIQLKLLYKSLN